MTPYINTIKHANHYSTVEQYHVIIIIIVIIKNNI